MKKMLMLATTAAMIEQFNKNNILILEEMGYEIHVVGNWKEGNPISDERLELFKEWLSEHHGKWFHISATRKPHDLRNNFSAYKEVIRLINKFNYEFIHCHTPIGSVIGRIAAHFTNTKIIYTAHGFHFYKGAPIKNWLLYYPIERILSYWTDVLITINKEDYERALGKFCANRTFYIKGVGIEKVRISTKSIYDVREKLSIPKEAIVLLSVGELNKNKNHRIVLEAMAKLNNKNLYYIVCGMGNELKKLRKITNKYELDNNVFWMGYQMEISSFYKGADIFIFPSYREGLSVSLMEAMASGLPILCSEIRGNTDLVTNNINGFWFNPNSVIDVATKIDYILNENVRCEMELKNIRDAQEFYSDNIMIEYKKIYSSIENMKG